MQRNRLACAVIVLVAMLVCLCGTAAFPVRITCGNVNYVCATAPDPAAGEYRLHYEWEPLAVTVVETLLGQNFRIFYASGEERVPTTP
jgi:hypothetical protein